MATHDPAGEQSETKGPQNVCQVEEEPQEQPNVLSIGRTVVQRRGYECEFVQPPPCYFQTDCFVCLQVLRDAHLVTCCGHNFCKECIGGVQKAGKSCPLCDKEGFTVTYNRAYDVSLKQLEVYCTNYKFGCEWKGKLEMLDKHLNVNPELEKLLEVCAFVELQCWHNGCGQSFQRRLIAKHQSRECSQRPFICKHCHEYKSTYHDVMTNHWPVCKCYPVSCPKRCTSCIIERRNLEQHLNKECPLTEVECEFKYAGCETKLPRKDMPGHLKENVGHLSLLARQNQELMVKLLEKDEQIGRMTDENRREMERKIESMAEEKLEQMKEQVEQLLEKDEQIRRMTDENRREMERKIESMAQEKLEQMKEQVEQRHQEDIDRLEQEKSEHFERLEKDYQRAMEKIRQKVKEMVPKAAIVQLEGRVTELLQKSETDHTKVEGRIAKMKTKVEGRIAEIENRSATSVTEVQQRITQLQNNKASTVEFKGYEDRVLTLERSAITRAERKKLTYQMVTKRELEDRIGGLERKQNTTKVSLEKLERSIIAKADTTKVSIDSHIQVAPLQIVMTDFGQRKRDKDEWYSEGFYTHPQGYKMCLRVYADGYEGTHIACFVYLMCGEFDNHLKWPFRGNVTIQLLNQRENSKHCTMTARFDDTRVTSGERATGGLGRSRFIPHSELGYTTATNCQYLTNDSLFFRVKVELL